MRISGAVAVPLLALSVAGCAGGAPGAGATPSTGSVSASTGSVSESTASAGGVIPRVAETVDGVVVNELDVLEPEDAQVMMRELGAQRGVVISRDSRLGTYIVWFPTQSIAELTKIKEALTLQGITANLIFVHPPLN